MQPTGKAVKKFAIILIVVFVLGWVIRVTVPYVQSQKRNDELVARRAEITLLLSTLYDFAQTNGGHFPNDLSEAVSRLNSPVKADVTKYIYVKPQPHKRDRIVSDVIIVAENEAALPGARAFFVGFQGNWVALKTVDEYRELLARRNRAP